MIPKSILFYWGKGANVRRKILTTINRLNKQNKPCFLNIISKNLKLSHVAIKKHLSLLLEENYISQINPHGKPIYLELTKKGKSILNKN